MYWLFIVATATAADVGQSVPQPVVAALKGRPGLVNIWATWCRPCRAELPLLDALHDRVEGQGGTVLAVNIDTQARPARALVSRLSLDLPIVYDADGSLADALAPPSLPATYLVDRDGTVRQVWTQGFEKAEMPAVEQALRALLK